MGLRGINVNGTNYAMDYNYLDNKPNIPSIPTVDPELDVNAYYTTLVASTCGNGSYDWQELFPKPYDALGGSVLTYSNGNIVWETLPEIPASSTAPPSSDGSGVPKYYGTTGSMSYSVLVPTSRASDSFTWRSLDEAIADMVGNVRTDNPQYEDSPKFLFVNDSGDLSKCEGIVVPTAGCNEGYIPQADGYGGVTWGPVDDVLRLNEAQTGDVLMAGGDDGMMRVSWEKPLPECTIDNGAVLYAGDSYGDYEWMSVGDVFMQGASIEDMLIDEFGRTSEGSVLAVGDNGDMLLWYTVDELLRSRQANVGDVLTIDEYGDAGWAAPTSGGESLPSHNSIDSGKVLTVNSAGGLVWRTPPSSTDGQSLPNYSPSDADKVLTVDETGGIAWKSFKGSVPTCGVSDSGKVLAVNSVGTATWKPLTDAITESTSYGGNPGVLTRHDDGTISWDGQQLPVFSSTALGSVMYADEYTDEETGEVVQVPRWGSVAIALGELDGGHDGSGDRVLMISGDGRIYWDTLPEPNQS